MTFFLLRLLIHANFTDWVIRYPRSPAYCKVHADSIGQRYGCVFEDRRQHGLAYGCFQLATLVARNVKCYGLGVLEEALHTVAFTLFLEVRMRSVSLENDLKKRFKFQKPCL